MSSHLKRWLTAMVALPLLVLIIGAGGRFFFVMLVGVVAALSLWEYYAMVLPASTRITKTAGVVLALTLLLSFSVGPEVVASVLVLVFFGAVVICLTLYDPSARTGAAEILFRQSTGFVYIPLLLGHLIVIRDWNQGVAWIFFLLAVVFAGDTAAYYIGKALGRHKLSPNISPGKTVEGAIGGLAGNLLVGLGFRAFYFPGFDPVSWSLLVLVTGALGQVGDLTASLLKRSVNVKDSGTIVPGHGGLLDRIDALLFAAPTLYYFKTYLL